jgi:hypothetical protein
MTLGAKKRACRRREKLRADHYLTKARNAQFRLQREPRPYPNGYLSICIFTRTGNGQIRNAMLKLKHQSHFMSRTRIRLRGHLLEKAPWLLLKNNQEVFKFEP